MVVSGPSPSSRSIRNVSGDAFASWRGFFSTSSRASELSASSEQLWRDLITNFSHWWDNRHDKPRPSYPDFRHKVSRQPLWLDSSNIPRWVPAKLASLEGKHPIDLHLLQNFHLLCQCGQVDIALHFLCEMPCPPTEHMYYSLLRACSQGEAIAHVKAVQAQMAEDPLACDGFLGEYLAIILAKCGEVVDVLHVFHKLSCRTVFSWTAVISGFIGSGNYDEALNAYQLMHQDGVDPNDYTFCSLLKACSSLCDLEKGKQIHREAFEFGYMSDIYVCTSLIDMYGKCGSIELARSIFDSLKDQNVVSWTVMLLAYVDNGLPDEAWQLYGQMQLRGISADDRAIVVALQACCMLAESNEEAHAFRSSPSMAYVTKGRGLYREACMKGFESDIFVCNSLISFYGVCRGVIDAECIFKQLHCCDIISWNAVLSVYLEGNLPRKALQLFRQLKDTGIPSSDQTFVLALVACGKLVEENGEVSSPSHSSRVATLEIVRALHSESRREGLNADVFVSNTIINMYGKCGSILEAENAFNGLLEHNVVSYNVLSLSYLRQGKGEMVLQIYKKMHDEGLVVNDRTFVCALQACCLIAEKENVVVDDKENSRFSVLSVGKALHDDARRMGLISNDHVACCLLSMYEKCGRSLLVVKRMFGELSHKSVNIWNTMLRALAEQGEGSEALQLLKQMQEKAVMLTSFTLMCGLQAAGETGDRESCEEVHFAVVSAGDDENLLTANTLIHSYGHCKCASDAQAVFDRLPNQDVVSWNALISAYAHGNKWASSLHWFNKMQQANVKPDAATFSTVLSACYHTGQVQKGLEYLGMMGRDHNIVQNLGHFNNIIETLAHAGDCLRVADLLSSIPVQPDLNFRLCFLGMCQKHGNMELARMAHDHVEGP